MKLFNTTLIALITIFSLSSCSDDDTNNVDSDLDDIIEGNYFPSSEGNFWNYDVSSTDNSTNETVVSQDSLYITASTATTLMLDVNDGLPANGPMIGLLTSGTLTKTATTLTLDGALELPEALSDLIDFDIALNNFKLYDVDASNNTTLATISNTITQDFNGFPLTISYQLTSAALSFDESLNLDGITYTNVATSEIKLNINVFTTVTVAGFPINLDILDSQDVLVSTNYFVAGIGLVRADSNTSYQISAAAVSALEAAGLALPIPTSGSTSIDQILSNYLVDGE